MFSSQRLANSWNARFAGKPAFTARNNKGYITGSILGTATGAHRVIFKLMTDEEPDEVDHANGCTDDNRWLNLQSVTHQVNQKNQKRRSDNTSGHTGVVYDRRRQMWGAQIHIAGKAINLGRFKSKDGAIEARLQAERTHNFHPNHGRR